ncbi:MAG: UPF0182 family protein [Terriglobia bacterium]
MTQERRARYFLALLLLLLVVAPLFTGGVNLLVDWLWFKQEGFRILFTNILKAQITLSGIAGTGFILIVSANLLVARALAHRSAYRVYGETVEMPVLDRVSSVFSGLIWIGVLLVGYILSHWAMTYWQEYMLNSQPSVIGQPDPIFGIDLGFYLFQLPFRWFLYYLAIIILAGCLLSSVFLYFVEGGVWVTPRGPRLAPAARAHLMTLGALLMLMMAYRVRLGMYGLLFSGRGFIFGAGYSDVNATLPVLRIVLVLTILSALLFLYGAVRGSLRPGLYGAAATLLMATIGGSVYPELVQRLIVTPNEVDKEAPYIARAIAFTRKAYALDRFEEREFPAVEDLKAQDIQANQPTIRNVRLWDHRPLLTTFAQLQEIRTYYDFRNVDNDRYWINGVYRQVSLSPRELNSASLQSRTWINEHLAFTHGYGVALGPVNEFTDEGLPELFIRDIPPVSTTNIRIERPEIYFGELGNEYCLVNTRAQELDYAAGDKNVYTVYRGDGGIPIEGMLRRVLFGLRFGEWKFLFSTDITAESRLMIYRRVLERAARLTPFLRYDGDPYLVITGQGSLVWMLDGYTTSEWYPYSDPTPGMGNFIRNSVKATVNAYTGRVKFYIADPSDPLIQAYSRLFPGVFEPLDAMPNGLRAHIRYPEDFFSVQARKYALFHMTDPRVFYNKEDLWRVAESAVRSASASSNAFAEDEDIAGVSQGVDRAARGASGGPGAMTPYYTIMKLAGVGSSEEFILMVPFAPARKDNMIAWMAARCDGPNYGRVLVFAFPKQKLVYGPQQIESRINQDPTISQQISLWDQRGSNVIRGTLLVIPVMNAILYVQPLYLAATAGGGLPQLTRVIVAYSDHIVMETSLEAALNRIFGSGASAAASGTTSGTTPPPGASATTASDVQSLIREANQHFERAQQLLRQGDFAGYGEENRKLGEVLKRLAAAPGQK